MKTELFTTLLKAVLESHTEKTQATANPAESRWPRELEDHRKAVSKLFREAVGKFPTQTELEAIDPAFKELLTNGHSG